jgi:hypothetical protein
VPPLAGSTVCWAAVGAVVGVVGYACSRSTKSVRPSASETAHEPAEWSPIAAVGWAAAVGLFSGGVWLAQVIAYEAMPQQFRLDRLVVGQAVEMAGLFALAGGMIGLVVGILSGLICARSSGLAVGIMRGIGFANVAAIGGGLFPFVVNATAQSIAPEVSSTVCWAVVGAIAGFVAYGFSRRTSRDADVQITPLSDEEEIAIRVSVRRPAAAPPEPMRAGLLPGDPSEPELVEEPAALRSGWGAVLEEDVGQQSRPRVQPTPQTASSSVVRIGPVLLVSAGCLLAVGLSAPSPVGWAMLAIGLMGLAVAWGLAGQERRICQLERRLQEAEHERASDPAEERSSIP